MRQRRAFTLAELLVVMAIIGLIAAMVVGGIQYANVAKKNSVVTAQKNALMLMINNYQSKLNFYPPDNAILVTLAQNNPLYDGFAATNPLLYELTGATNYPNNSPGTIEVFDGTSVTNTYYQNYYGRSIVVNGNTDEPHDFYIPGPQPRDYFGYDTNTGIKGLVVPVPFTPTNSGPNFWHYDSSSPYRHNLTSYDLWAEYATSAKGGSNIITTNGNW